MSPAQTSILSSVFFVCDMSKRQHSEEESVRKRNEETTAMGHVQVTLEDDNVKLKETTNTSRSAVRHKDTVCDENLSGLNHICRISGRSAEGSPLVYKGATLF